MTPPAAAGISIDAAPSVKDRPSATESRTFAGHCAFTRDPAIAQAAMKGRPGSPVRPSRRVAAIRGFLRQESASGVLLLGVTVLALFAANSPLAPTYAAAIEAPLGIRLGTYELSKSLLHWINDGLMAVFFLLVGLEIKREILDGHLSSVSRLALPVLGALGGMLFPAFVYVAINWQHPAALRGWAIPAATDIAFALGVLAMLGPRVPLSLKVFLTALAILDDLGAVVIIALFYAGALSLPALGLAAAGLLVLATLNRFGVRALSPYMLVGAFVWFCFLKSGVHATIAGVAVALLVPLHASPGRPDDPGSPLHLLEHALQPWVAFAIVPVFAFANAGVSLDGIGWSALLDPLPLGIAAGLFIGKQLGVFLFAAAAIRLGWARLPAGATWAQLYAVSILCGIGFTMSLFIGALAFPSDSMAAGTKIGVLVGSGLSGVVGLLVLAMASPPRSQPLQD
jgi:Na+:H+ antiporter, NhaA family